MKKRTQNTLLLAIGLLLLIGVTAGASIYATKELDKPTETVKTVKHHTAHKDINWDHASAAPQQPAQQQVASTCTDHNIIGTGIGAVAGGVVGNRFGKGDGRTVAMVGGALGGAYLGNQLIPTQNALCK